MRSMHWCMKYGQTLVYFDRRQLQFIRPALQCTASHKVGAANQRMWLLWPFQ